MLLKWSMPPRVGNFCGVLAVGFCKRAQRKTGIASLYGIGNKPVINWTPSQHTRAIVAMALAGGADACARRR